MWSSKQLHYWFAVLASLVIAQGQLLGAWHEATHHVVPSQSSQETHSADCSGGGVSVPHVELDQDHSTCPVCVLNQTAPHAALTTAATALDILGSTAIVPSHFLSKEQKSTRAPRAPPVVRFG